MWKNLIHGCVIDNQSKYRIFDNNKIIKIDILVELPGLYYFKLAILESESM